MTLVNSVSYEYQVNGFLSHILYPQRGLRQGDPISRYLFIMVFDVLSRMLSHGRNVHDLRGVDIASDLPMTHPFFVDDAILFAKASQGEMYALMGILNKFSKASGQRVDLQKSGLAFSSEIRLFCSL